MSVLSFGQTLATSTLQNFKPVLGIPSVVSILKHDQVLAHEVFWAPKEVGLDIFGPFMSSSPIAKKAFGEPSVYYTFPVFVHNSLTDAGGIMMTWRVSKSLYNSIIEVSKVADLNKFSLQVVSTKQGQGTRTTVTPIPQPLLRDYWPADYKANIEESVRFWFEVSDASLYRTISEQELISELTQVGYDFNTNSFPNRLQQQASYFAQRSVQEGVNSLIGNQQIGMISQQPQRFAISQSQPIQQQMLD